MNIYLKNLLENIGGNLDEKEILKEVINGYYDKNLLDEINDEYFIPWTEKGFFKDSKERNLKLKKNPDKKYLAETMSIFLTDRETFEKAFDSMEMGVKKAFFLCVWYNGADIANLSKDYQIKIKRTEKTGRILEVKFRFFKTHDIYRGMQKGEIEIHPVISGFLREFMIPPIELNIKGIKNTNTKYSGNFEMEIIENIQLLVEMRKNNDIRLGTNGKVLKSVFSFFEKNVQLKEFYENSRNVEENNIKKEILIKVFSALQLNRIKQQENPEEMIKEIVTKMFSAEAFLEEEYYYGNRYSINLAKTILSNLKVKLHTYEVETIKKYMESLKYTLKEISPEGWVEIGDIINFMIVNEGLPFTYLNNFSKSILSENNLYPYRDMQKMEQNIINFIVVPFNKGVMSLLASFGVVEIAYDDRERNENREQNSIYSGIKYIKVTELGKYILGLKDSYELKPKESTMEILLSEKELLMTATGEDRRKELIISKISEKTGDNIYRVNNKTLFAGCNKKEEVKFKIESFKKIVKIMPENWKNYFDKIDKSFNPIEKVENIVVMKIKDDKELIDIIAKNDKLKELILKAEKYHILIEEANVAAVKYILKEYGYF